VPTHQSLNAGHPCLHRQANHQNQGTCYSDPVTRLLNLAFFAGDLLSFEEQVFMKIIRSTSWFLDEHAPELLLEIKHHRVRQAWAAIESLAKYEISQEEFDSLIIDLRELSND